VPRDPAAYSMAQVVDDLSRVLAWGAGETPAVVGGLSFGGLASLHFALAQPQRVRALLLVDTGPGFKNPEAQARWEAQVERTAAFLEARGGQAFVESRAAATAVGLRPELPAARAAARAIAAQDPAGLALFARRVAAVAPPVIDQLASIEIPALVVVGEKDEPYLRAAEVLASRLPQAEAVRIPGAGHVVNLETPEAFDAAVLGFLRRVALLKT
jgi:pimeloyl-ACP methyl ester carboxylesterase